MKHNPETEKFFLSLLFDKFITIDEYGNVINNQTQKEIGYVSANGYKTIGWRIGEKVRNQLVHRLVHILYNDGFTEDQPLCNHKDGNKLNNHFSNLERCSAEENMQHAFKTGLKFVSEETKGKISESRKNQKGNNSKFTNEEVVNLRERYKLGGCTHRSLAKEFNMDHSTIGDILRKDSYNF